MSKRVKKTVSILPDLWTEAEDRAKRGDCSTSRVVERAMRVAFANMPTGSPVEMPKGKRKRQTTAS